MDDRENPHGIFPSMDEALDGIDGMRGLAALWERCCDLMLRDGVQALAYHHYPGPLAKEGYHRSLAIFARGWPPRGVSDYVEGKTFRTDPIQIAVRLSSRPVLWSRIGDVIRLTPEDHRFVRLLRDAGFRDGLTFPAFHAGGRLGTFSLGLAMPGAQLPRAVQRRLQLIGQIAHGRFCELAPVRDLAASALSTRESEVLTWVGQGKSNAEIAIIMGLSRHTVDTHLRRLFGKLGVTERISAAVLAVGAGLVPLDRFALHVDDRDGLDGGAAADDPSVPR